MFSLQINGVEVEVPLGFSVKMNSVFLNENDLSQRGFSFSNVITLPPTANNLRVFNDPSNLDGRFFEDDYTFHLQLEGGFSFEGVALPTSYDKEKGIKIQLSELYDFWGVASQIKLNDLELSSYEVRLTEEAIATELFTNPRHFSGDDSSPQRPMFKVKKLFELFGKRAGYDVTVSDLVSDLVIASNTKSLYVAFEKYQIMNKSFESRTELQGVPALYNSTNYVLQADLEDSNAFHVNDLEGVLNVKGCFIGKVANGRITLEITTVGDDGDTTMSAEVVEINRENGTFNHLSQPMTPMSSVQIYVTGEIEILSFALLIEEGALFAYNIERVEMLNEEEQERFGGEGYLSNRQAIIDRNNAKLASYEVRLANVMQRNKEIAIENMEPGAPQTPLEPLPTPPELREVPELAQGFPIPLYDITYREQVPYLVADYNLPLITAKSFFKDIMKMFFLGVKIKTSPRGVVFEKIALDTINNVDLTNKIDEVNAYTVANMYSKLNVFRYANDENVSNELGSYFFNGKIPTNEGFKDFIVIDNFSASVEDSGVAKLDIYNNNARVSIKDRVLITANGVARFAPLSFNNLVPLHYENFIESTSEQKLIILKAVINSADFKALQARPIIYDDFLNRFLLVLSIDNFEEGYFTQLKCLKYG